MTSILRIEYVRLRPGASDAEAIADIVAPGETIVGIGGVSVQSAAAPAFPTLAGFSGGVFARLTCPRGAVVVTEAGANPEAAEASGVRLVAGGSAALLPVETGQRFAAISAAETAVPSGTNVTTTLREAFETYAPAEEGSGWDQVLGAGDIVQVDGNAAASSYLVISKDPLTVGGVTTVTSRATFDMPLELALGLSMSQRTLGQEFAVEVVSVDDPSEPSADIAITSVSQTTTTLTVTTTAPHGLVPGKRIGIWGNLDSRFNYPSLVVASIPTPTTFTATAGPMGTIPSVTAGPVTGGFVYRRSAVGYAQDGTSLIFESASATQGSVHVRSNSGDAMPSGAYAGSHSVTLLTTASVAAINAARTYAFLPTNEYRLAVMADKLQWTNVPVDSVSQASAISTRTQVIPNPTKKYKLRIRATNNKGYTVPVGQIVSAVKTGTTTATLTFDREHGLTLTDQIITAGIRDIVNFPNLAVATAIASIVSPTAITVVIAGAVTATSYGGFGARVQGGNVAIGAGAQNIQSATLAAGVLTLVGNTTWTAALIGDYVNLVGVRNAVDGASLGLDGAWKVRNVATTNLELEPLTGTVPPADFGLTNCGGGIIKRTDLRIAFIRLFDYERERVEMMARPTGDQASAAPVSVQGTATVGGTVAAAGTTADNASGTPSPVLVGAMQNSTAGGPAAGTTARHGALQADLSRRLVITGGGVPQSHDYGRLASLTTTTEATLVAAVALIRHELHQLAVVNRDTVPHTIDFRDTTGGTVRASVYAPAGQTVPLIYPSGLPQGAVNTNWTAQLREVTTTTAVEVTSSSYRTTA